MRRLCPVWNATGKARQGATHHEALISAAACSEERVAAVKIAIREIANAPMLLIRGSRPLDPLCDRWLSTPHVCHAA